MPELPEVETVVRGLQSNIINLTIKDIIIKNPALRIMIDDNIHSIKNTAINSVSRKAKYIIISTDSDATLVVHLGMSGKLILSKNADDIFSKHDHYRIYLDNGYQLTYNDPRRFGLATITPEQHNLFANLGVEPLTQEFNADYLHEKIHHKKAPIKSVIMDNRVVVGVGNIYANESLFRARILPTRPANQLTKNEAGILVEEIKDTLNEAILAGGSTLKDHADISGKPGYFQHNFHIYGKSGSKCKTCRHGCIQSIAIAGRASFFCGSCQK